MCVCSLISHVQFLRPPQTVACQAPIPWNYPGKYTEVGSHYLLQGSSQPKDQTQVSCIASRIFTI